MSINSVDLITKLEADLRDSSRVHVYIDGRHVLAVSLDVAAAERLTVGQPCPAERLAKLQGAQELEDIYQKALTFLSFRPRSAREVEQRLRKKGFAPEDVEPVMVRLRRVGLVDDEAFARFWVSNRMQFSPRGARLLKSELRQKGVAAAVVDDVLAAHAEEMAAQEAEAQRVGGEYGLGEDDPVPGSDLANALALAGKRMRLLSGLDEQTTRRRLVSFLARRGYSFDTIDAVWRWVRPHDSEEDG